MNNNYQIDNQSRKAVYEQIIEQVERFILAGLLKPGDQLPSVRSLSIELNLNPNTVQRAYSELERRGVIYTITGKGSFVDEKAREVISSEKRRELPQLFETLKQFSAAGIEKQEILDIVNYAYMASKEEQD